MKVYMRYVITGLVVVFLLMSSGCVSQTPVTPTPTPTITQAAPTTVAPTIEQQTGTPGVASVQIKGFAFVPSVLRITKGTTVAWTQKDSGVTHIVSGSGFNSGQLTEGQTFNYTFNEAGTFDYNCSIHPNMIGKIIVT